MLCPLSEGRFVEPDRKEEDMRLTRASASERAFESDWMTSCMRSALCGSTIDC